MMCLYFLSVFSVGVELDFELFEKCFKRLEQGYENNCVADDVGNVEPDSAQIIYRKAFKETVPIA